MRTCICFVAISLLLTGLARAQAQSQDAILRCDPGTVIQDMDGGSRSFYAAGEGSAFKECAIPLSQGPHTLRVCFSLGATGSTSISGAEVASGNICMEKRELTVDAQAGRTYRVKFDFSADWKAFIEDVTEAEAGLSYEVPPEKPKPGGRKKDRETVLVLRATPQEAALVLKKGVIRGKWLDVGQFGAVVPLNLSRKGVPDGYHIFRVHEGDTVAFTSGSMMGGSAFKLRHIVACGGFVVRVHENIPAGKVFYIGHLTFKDAPWGYVATHSDDDLAEARAYVDSTYPELAGRLEAMTYREARMPNVCRGTGGYDLAPFVDTGAPR